LFQQTACSTVWLRWVTTHVEPGCRLAGATTAALPLSQGGGRFGIGLPDLRRAAHLRARLVATFLIVLIFAWNEFLIALVLTSANAQTMPLQVAAQNATRGPQWWAMSVLILIMITPVVAMAILLERYITRGILVGSLNG
jgi:hypothetical protein